MGALPAKNSTVHLALFAVTYLSATLLLLAYVARLLLALPAVATDEEGEQLARAWNRTRGNGLRLWFGLLLCGLPFATIQAAKLGYAYWTGGLLTLSVSWPSVMVSWLLSILGTAVAIAFYSYSFRELADATLDEQNSSGHPLTTPAQ